LESKKTDLVEDLLRFFVAQGEKEMFTCCLFTCYDLIRPDIAMELSWRFGLLEYAMPFFI
jgi:clathrin heavy chain